MTEFIMTLIEGGKRMPAQFFEMKNRMGDMLRMILYIGFFILQVIIGLPVGVYPAFAETSHPEGWYRHRTNSVPYQPQNVSVDAAGGVWVSAEDGSEYAPGVWYRPSGSAANSFQVITNDRRNNLSAAGFNPPIEKPQLNATVLCAVRDKAGNTWYGLKNRKVLCEKVDKSWLTFDMPNSSSIDPGINTIGVDSAYRIRLIDHLDGTQDKLLISYRGILHVNAAFTVIASRQVSTSYNNDFIRDALIDTQGRYWITSERGLEKGTSLVNTTYIKDINASDPLAPKEGTVITRIVEDSLRNIWFGSDSYEADGVYRFTSAGAWNKYTDGIVSAVGKRVHDIAADTDGSVWFGAVYSGDGGILRFVPSSAGGQWYRYRGTDLGLDSEEIPGLGVGGGGLWFVTGYTPTVTGNGTGVHFMTLDQGTPHVTHYTYRGRSTTLTSLYFNYIAADLKGGVWFPAYDDPSIARLKADGSWEQFRQAGNDFLGNFGIHGVAVDSKNKVYFAPLNSQPVAYDATTEQWIDLPAVPFSEFYYYRLSEK
jgi:streptogramin lyase